MKELNFPIKIVSKDLKNRDVVLHQIGKNNMNMSLVEFNSRIEEGKKLEVDGNIYIVSKFNFDKNLIYCKRVMKKPTNKK